MYKVLDLFSGCGGLSEGFLQAGFNVAVSVEIDKQACETQAKNHPETQILCEDLTQLSPRELQQRTGHQSFDLIIGGPPCQGFSLIGTRLGTNKELGRFIEDPRIRLYKEFVKYVRYFQPKMFMLENVPGLFSMQGGLIKRSIENDFSQDDPSGEYIGYDVKSTIVKAVEFGVPQNRERVIFMGVRKDFKMDFDFPEPKFKGKYFTVFDAISDLPPLAIKDGEFKVKVKTANNKFLNLLNNNAKILPRENGYEKGYLFNHISRFHNERDQGIFRMLEPFQKLCDLDPKLIPIRLRNGFNDFYRKMDYKKPSPTIIAHLNKDGLAFIHPEKEQARSISVREAARLQTFPDNFVFVGAQTVMFKQIGNAVPPILAYHLALNISEILECIEGVQNRVINL